jgi:hypothetical protein
MRKVSKYALFFIESYYPIGGLGDLKGFYDTIEEARAAVTEESRYDWYELADTDTWEVIDDDFKKESST